MLSANISSFRACTACFEWNFSNLEFLCLCLAYWCICSGYASVPDVYAQQTHRFLMPTLRVRISSWCTCSACFKGTISNFIRAFSAWISSWRVCSVYAPNPDAYAKPRHHFLMHMLSARISSWHVCSVQTSIPYATSEGLQNKYLKNGKTDAHEQKRDWCICAHQMRMLRVRIKVWACM